MILYVNGDSHGAGAEAVNTFCFACDDPQYQQMNRQPHPDNLRVSYGQLIALNYNATFTCDAESGSSNARIIRTTNTYLDSSIPDLVIIGWASWEREEVVIDGTVYQFSAGLDVSGGFPPIPEKVKVAYRNWVVDRYNVQTYCDENQEQIWSLHQRLLLLNIPHVFFNTYSGLTPSHLKDWGKNYLNPYDHTQSYFKLLKEWGYLPVSPTSYHYGADAHIAWANYLTNYINEGIIAT